MRKSKFTDMQIVAIFREAEAGVAVSELLRKRGLSRPTYYLWKQKFGGAGVPELQRLKALEQETAKLKRLYAEQAFELVAIKDVLTRKL
jgi:putative transposase